MNATVCSLVFLRRDDQILLAMKKRGFGGGRWNGAGGKLEPGETPEQSAIRETQEEIGVTPRSLEKVAELDFLMQEGDEPWHMYVHAYLCSDWQGEPAESEEMRPQWFAIPDIPYDGMWPDDRHWLPKVLAGHHLTATFTFDQHNQLLTHDIAITR